MHRCALTVFIVGFIPAVALGQAEAEARALVEKSIKAHGGADKLDRLRNVRLKLTGTIKANGVEAQFTGELATKLPDRSKLTLELDVNNVKILVVNVHQKAKAWARIAEQVEELSAERLLEQQMRSHQMHVANLVPLIKGKDHRLSPLGEIKVEGRPAVGVRVETKGRQDISLYFDKENALLVKMERRGLDLMQKDVAVEVFYSAYKEFDGVKQPTKRVTHHDGNVYTVVELTELRVDDQIADSEFERP